MTFLTKALSSVGLMTVKEHEALNDLYHRMAKERNDALILEAEATAKFKKAVTDLEKQAVAMRMVGVSRDLWREEADELRPDALAMRRKRQMDRDRKAAKKGAGNG